MQLWNIPVKVHLVNSSSRDMHKCAAVWRGLIDLSSLLMPMTFSTKGFHGDTDTQPVDTDQKLKNRQKNDLYRMLRWTPFTSFSTARNDARERDSDSPEGTFSQTWKRLPATEWEKSLYKTDEGHTSQRRKKRNVANKWLTDRTSPDTVEISTRTSITWPAEFH